MKSLVGPSANSSLFLTLNVHLVYPITVLVKVSLAKMTEIKSVWNVWLPWSSADDREVIVSVIASVINAFSKKLQDT